MLSVTNQPEPSQQYKTPTPIWTRRLIIMLAILASLALAWVLLSIASHIITSLLIFAVAALVAYAIIPVVNLFSRVMPRAVAILIVYLVVMVLLGFIIYLIISTTVTQLVSLAQNISKYLMPGNNGQDSPLILILNRIGITQGQIDTIRQQLGSQLTNIAGTVAGGVVPILGGVASAALNILLTVVISIYLLVDGSRTVRWLTNRTPSSQRGRIGSLIHALQIVVGGYIRGQFALCLIIGFIVGIGLTILGMPYSVLLGVLSFVTEFIPVLGTIICGTIAVLLALTQGWLTAILVLAFFVIVHIFEGYILAPRLVGKAVGLHPVVSLLALTIGSELFGPWGAIFASPVAGLFQAFAAAFWLNYRRTHKEEFPDESPEEASKSVEELAESLATPATTALDSSTKNE